MSSSRFGNAVVDTVVLHYFLLAGRADLLVRLLCRPIHVPRVVYDPDEPPGTPPTAMSELTRGIDHHHRRGRDQAVSEAERKQAAERGRSLEVVHRLAQQGDLVVADMTDEERSTYARLTSRRHVTALGVRFPLGPGEAASLVIAVHRDWTFVTDDSDALRVLGRLRPGHPYERIRRLLRRAGETGLTSQPEANSLHDAMRHAGFWDHQPPFPTGTARHRLRD